MEVHWTSNLSEFPLRVAFARAVLHSSRSSRTFGAPNSHKRSKCEKNTPRLERKNIENTKI
ncbi:hypothetical protein CJI57_00630 [Bifidobacteriaceae bacterium WP012]|nr:hypothetical protein CJI57_00630 [Bifidobacteriaceae bacterium WP012]